MMAFGTCFTLTLFAFLIQCDNGFSKLIPPTTNDSPFQPTSTELDDFHWEQEDVDQGFWDDEDVALVRGGYGQNYSGGPVVTTDCGKYKGLYGGSGKECKYEKFLGIPYAQPPVGPLRFQNAQPADCQPDMEYQATQFGPPCKQPTGKALETSRKLSSEDCLCLNIYRPEDCNIKDEKPVLFYIHESYFLYGSASQPELNGGCLAALGDIIVVTINYRLGAFGWLYSGNDVDIPGNMAYTDVLVALNWVKDNIKFFGGDPKAITAGGHGSGAVIVTSLLLNYEIPKDLYQGLMIMSPTYNPQTYYDSGLITLMKSNAFIQCIGCGRGSKTDPFSEDEETCVKATDAGTIAEASEEIPFYDGNGFCSRSQLLLMYRRISVDDRLQKSMFLKDKYIYIGAVNTEFKKSLIGSKAKTKDEGAEIIAKKVTPIILNPKSENVEKIIDYYLGKIVKEDPFAVGKRTTLALNNVCYDCPVDNLIKDISPFNDVYAYQYSYVASCNEDDPKRCYGAYHLDDVPFGFGQPFRVWSKYNDYDREVSRTVIGYWSDFVYQGKMKWPKYDSKDRSVQMIKGAKKENYYEPSPYTEICEKLEA